ncbi:hypothetical protein DICVIV_13032 [Dictyocaulus viviparus]|uniref:Exonuclease domain-containing protein n=1 Tax=Dictyocaulus viviparus TaxID=29172 RepID=A0A0D8X8U5_DICVI|nr:hypothetical protein DICVIV_13032 [Dictyocaulus viviparus]
MIVVKKLNFYGGAEHLLERRFIAARFELLSDESFSLDNNQLAAKGMCYAIDCEFVYTTWGKEPARITVVDVLRNKVLDCVFRTVHELIDPNTQYSGLTAEEIEGSDVSLDNMWQVVRIQTICHTDTTKESYLLQFSATLDLIGLCDPCRQIEGSDVSLDNRSPFRGGQFEHNYDWPRPRKRSKSSAHCARRSRRHFSSVQVEVMTEANI